MEDRAQSDNANKQHRIRELNDRLRCQSRGGRIVVTRGVGAIPREVANRALGVIQAFDEFTPNNDPYGEHDFGQVLIEGHTIMWKIDYYDANLEWGSPDPADDTVTCRVMTIMLASDL